MPTLVDSFTTAPDNARRVYLTGYSRVGQSWTGQAGVKLTSLRLNLRRFGSPAGSATIAVFAHTGVYGTSSLPTGAALASTTLLLSTVPDSAYTWIDVPFTGAGQIALAAQYYCWEFRYDAGDISNCVAVATREFAGPYHSGNWFRYASGAYVAASGGDANFEVWAEQMGSPAAYARMLAMNQGLGV